jgi:hypothetical protein
VVVELVAVPSRVIATPDAVAPPTVPERLYVADTCGFVLSREQLVRTNEAIQTHKARRARKCASNIPGAWHGAAKTTVDSRQPRSVILPERLAAVVVLREMKSIIAGISS